MLRRPVCSHRHLAKVPVQILEVPDKRGPVRFLIRPEELSPFRAIKPYATILSWLPVYGALFKIVDLTKSDPTGAYQITEIEQSRHGGQGQRKDKRLGGFRP